MRYLYFKYVNISVVLILLFIGGGCETSESYKITGMLYGFADNTKVSLTLAATHQDEKKEMETTVQDGKFTFVGKLVEPRYYMLTIEEPTGVRGTYGFMLENSDITFSAVRGEQQEGRPYVELKDVQLKGSVTDQIFREKMAFREKLDQMFVDYREAHAGTIKKISELRKNGDRKVITDFMQTDDYKNLVKAEREAFQTIEKVIHDSVAANGDSFWGPLLLLNNRAYFSSNDTEAKELFNGFSEEAKNSFYGQALKKQIFPKTLKGKSVPEFSLPDRNEKVYSMKELSKGKKCVLIDFWASWCGPCMDEMPNVKAIYEKYHDRGLEIVGVSMDNNKANWERAIERAGLVWHHVSSLKGMNRCSVAKLYQVVAIPKLYIIGKDGKIIAKDLRGEELREKIDELFEE